MSLVPEIRATHCTRYRFRYSGCRRCEQACPHGAIRLSDEGVAIASEACAHCGLCVSACRTETFAEPSLAPLALIDKARGRRSFTVACEPCGSDADAIVPCLGAVAPALLAYIARQGTGIDLVGGDRCADCAHGARGAEQLAAVMDALDFLRSADATGQWASVSRVQRSRTDPQPGDERRSARRTFFRRVAQVGQRAPRPAVGGGVAAPLRAIRAARETPSPQRDLLQMLGLADAAEPLAAHACLPAGDVRLESGCTGCEACARACPTGALQVRESATVWTLAFEAGRCVACAVCVEACQPHVLHLREQVAAVHFTRREAVALRTCAKRRCTRCDRSFVSAAAAALCDVCAGDEEDFEAMFG